MAENVMNKDKKRRPKVKKDSQLLIRINKEERDAFLELCDELDTSAAREIRKFVRKFMSENSTD
jgi:hypothetical protein